jgi:hypothetical protein
MSTHIYKTIKEVIKHPENYAQCIACGNPVDNRHKVDGCPTCGGHYYEAEENKDFSNLEKYLNELDEEIEV